MTKPDYLDTVNHVIAICKDAEQGFQGAAKHVDDPSLKSTFEELSNERGRFAIELESTVERLGAHADEPSGIAGKLHSGWMAVKGALSGHSSHQILEETERGEDLSVKTYREALAQNLPAELRTVIENQFERVQQGHNRIRSLRDASAKTT